jgi:hypothetical protein
MTPPGSQPDRRASRVWLAAIVVLLALRLPSLAQPAGGDQGLYGYSGQRILAGGVMYRDIWDQKPPALAFLYAGLWRLHPSQSVVPAADLVAAAAVAWALVVLGRLRYSSNIGFGAAAAFLFLGDPYLQRLSGIYVRGQAEPFIALAIAASLVMLAHPARRRSHLVGAGVALAVAFWLKYNAAAYGLPLAVAAAAWAPPSRATWRHVADDLGWMALGFVAVGTLVLGYFAANGALEDLRLATLDYNLRYSNETYDGISGLLRYLVTFPIVRARIEPLWFVGGLGTVLLLLRARGSASTLIVFSWVAAAIVSIAINGGRSLPNYFVQANPALALAASAGLATLVGASRWIRYAVAVLLLGALWRVGSDAPVWGLRLASIPGFVQNVRYDLGYIRGAMDRDTYLSRFRGQKHDALENEQLVRYVRRATTPADAIFVFGFSGGSVCWLSERVSSSRFFWSRPVTTEFAADHPGYGSQGLLADLERRPPAILALQKEEWHSLDFFMSRQPLRNWLEAGYTLDHETSMFSVWRRKQ